MTATHLRTALLGALLAAAPAAAQHRGTVHDDADRPVAGATVELWAGTRLAATTRTGADGSYELAPSGSDGPHTLGVRRIGHRTHAVAVAPDSSTRHHRLQPSPVALAPVTVAAAPRRTCPNREDPRARAHWERMRARYWQEGMDTVRVIGFAEGRSGVAEREEIGQPGDGRERPSWSYGIAAAGHHGSLRGYASRASGGAGERTAHWHYYGLDGGTFQDFTQAPFGERHTLSLLSAGPEATVIAFCPRRPPDEAGRIEGTLVLRPDNTLRTARWSWRTRPPQEDAGAEVHYLHPDAAPGAMLLGEETLFWRRTTGGRFYFEGHRFALWRPRERGEVYRPPRP